MHTLVKPPSAGWSSASVYVSRELVEAEVPPAEKGDKIKVFIRGTSSLLSVRWFGVDFFSLQGEIGGVLKELLTVGYIEEQVLEN